MPSPALPEERLSAEFDAGHITDEVIAEVGTDRSDMLIGSWQQLGNTVRQIPVCSAGDLSSRVMARIQKDAATQVTQLRYPDSHRQSALAQWVAVLASAAAVVLVSLSLMSVFNASGETSGASAVAGNAADVRDIPDWEVVVVTLPDNGQHRISDLVRETVNGSGLQLHALAGHVVLDDGHPDILMASAGLSERVHELFHSDMGDLDAQFNPDRIGDLDREELLRKVAESMQTPTQSDLYFGEMSVVLPGDNSIVVRALPPGTPLDEIMVAGTGTDHVISGRPNSDGPGDKGRVNEATISEYLKKGNGKPVLVVVLRRKAVVPENQGSFYLFRRAAGKA